METNAVERSRPAIIAGVLTPIYSAVIRGNVSILDIGCGEAGVVDFLPKNQNYEYIGVDLSTEAIKLAQMKRGFNSHFRFIQSAAHDFSPPHFNFDVIIFSEVLYYTEYETVMNQYLTYLAKPHGIMIISVFRTGDRLYPKMAAIFEYASEIMSKVDTMDVDGFLSRKEKPTVREKTGFHIEVFKIKN
jgi:2-polyprenyl-3-methyl-5-hydroxy-6-metoxy-1,4-benzoquinol methylase